MKITLQELQLAIDQIMRETKADPAGVVISTDNPGQIDFLSGAAWDSYSKLPGVVLFNDRHGQLAFEHQLGGGIATEFVRFPEGRKHKLPHNG